MEHLSDVAAGTRTVGRLQSKCQRQVWDPRRGHPLDACTPKRSCIPAMGWRSHHSCYTSLHALCGQVLDDTTGGSPTICTCMQTLQRHNANLTALAIQRLSFAPRPSCLGRMTALMGSERPCPARPSPAPCPSKPHFASMRDPNPAHHTHKLLAFNAAAHTAPQGHYQAKSPHAVCLKTGLGQACKPVRGPTCRVRLKSAKAEAGLDQHGSDAVFRCCYRCCQGSWLEAHNGRPQRAPRQLVTLSPRSFQLLLGREDARLQVLLPSSFLWGSVLLAERQLATAARPCSNQELAPLKSALNGIPAHNTYTEYVCPRKRSTSTGPHMKALELTKLAETPFDAGHAKAKPSGHGCRRLGAGHPQEHGRRPMRLLSAACKAQTLSAGFASTQHAASV